MIADERITDSFIDAVTLKKIILFIGGNDQNIVSSLKEDYLKRRIFIRARILKMTSGEEYYKFLKQSESEVKSFLNVITVNVSYFFRNPEVFDTLKEKVLPEVFKRKANKKEAYLKILSIGCACGEEPYSIAMILSEYFQKELQTVKPHILGIDFDGNSIVQARIGQFDEQKLAYTPGLLKKKFFDIIDYKKYNLNHEIKKMVVFKQDNIFDKPLKRYWDIIFCRNMLIYLKHDAQNELISNVHSVLFDGGYLFLGKSEGLYGTVRSAFKPVFVKERIYMKKRSDYES